MKSSFFVFILTFTLVITSSASVSAITKNQVGAILQRELYNYFEGNPIILTTDEMRALVAFHSTMSPVSDVPLSGTSLPANVRSLLETSITPFAPLPLPPGEVPEEENDQGLLNGRDIGVYCGDKGHVICKTRYCSFWGVCEANPLGDAVGLKELYEDCRSGHECQSGTCYARECRPKTCGISEECLSGDCRVRWVWNGQVTRYCGGNGY